MIENVIQESFSIHMIIIHMKHSVENPKRELHAMECDQNFNFIYKCSPPSSFHEIEQNNDSHYENIFVVSFNRSQIVLLTMTKKNIFP